MSDTPLKVRQLVKTSHFAFFTVVIILALLLFSNNIVNAQTVSGNTNGSTWSYDDSSMESAVVKYKLYMPDDTSFLNQEDSGFPYQEPCFDNDGFAVSYTKFRGALGDKNYIDSTFVQPQTFNNTNTSFNIPDSFTINGSTFNTSDFSSANMFAGYSDYHPFYCLVLCNDSSQYNAIDVGAGFSFWATDSDDIYIFQFSEGMYLTGIYKPYNINGRKALFYGPVAFCGNSPILSYYTQTLPSSRPNAPDNWFQFSQSDHAENINYLQLGKGSDYEDGSGGDADNNLYVRSADWKFNIPKYCNSHGNIQLDAPVTRNWGEGTAIFSALLNDWQKANPDKLNIDYHFHVYLYLRYENDVNDDIGVWAYNFSANIEQGFSDFISDGCSKTFKVSDIFQYCRTDKNNTVTDILDTLKQHSTYDILDTVWYLDCTAKISNSQNGNNTSGPIKERYYFTNQISKELENTITENKNPYVDDDGKPHVEEPDDDSNSTTSDDGKIILTNNDNDNNNQTVTIDNGHDEIINTLYDKLVPADTDSNGGLTDRFLNLTQSNRWFDLMATAMPYIPMEFWNTMYHLLVVCLGITGIAFLIWIVCHII